jgi:hypothetical protein
MKRELLRIAKDLDKEKITELQARKLLLSLLSVSNSNLPLWVRPLLMITTMAASTLYIIYSMFYCC